MNACTVKKILKIGGSGGRGTTHNVNIRVDHSNHVHVHTAVAVCNEEIIADGRDDPLTKSANLQHRRAAEDVYYNYCLHTYTDNKSISCATKPDA